MFVTDYRHIVLKAKKWMNEFFLSIIKWADRPAVRMTIEWCCVLRFHRRCKSTRQGAPFQLVVLRLAAVMEVKVLTTGRTRVCAEVAAATNDWATECQSVHRRRSLMTFQTPSKRIAQTPLSSTWDGRVCEVRLALL